MLDGRRVGERLVCHLLQRDDLTATIAAVGSDQEAAFRVVDSIAQRLGAEPAEDHVVHRADARAGEHRDGELGDERQVDRDAIAFADAERLEHVRERRHLAIEFEVGQRAAIAGLAFPDEGGLVAPRTADMAVETVDARVDASADEPFRVRRLPVEHRIPRAGPFELRREPRPKAFRIALRLVVDPLVVDDRLRAECRRRRKRAVFAQQVAEFGGALGVGHAAKNTTIAAKTAKNAKAAKISLRAP